MQAVINSFWPSVIVNTASVLTWRGTESLKHRDSAAGALGLGAWLPFHLAPALGIARALQVTRSRAYFVNCAFPDAVNCIVARAHGVVPMGCGNVELVVPYLRDALRELHPVGNAPIDFKVIAHHAHTMAIRNSEIERRIGLPRVRGVIGTQPLLARDVDAAFTKFRQMPRPSDAIERSQLVAAGALEKLCWLSEGSGVGHMPGPAGLVGGYPVSYENGRVSLRVDGELELDEANEMNLQGQRADGIESISGEGEVTFTDEVSQIHSSRLGREFLSIAPRDARRAATELKARYFSAAAV